MDRFGESERTVPAKMTSRALYSLYIDLYENGHLKDIRDFTEDERDAICMEIEDLWMDQYRYDTRKCEFRVGMNPDGDMLYLVSYEDAYHCSLPGDCMIREVTIGAPKVNEETLKLVGDRIPLRLPGFPLRRLHVQFSDV